MGMTTIQARAVAALAAANRAGRKFDVPVAELESRIETLEATVTNQNIRITALENALTSKLDAAVWVPATTTTAGYMTAADKIKLNSL